VVRPGLVYGRGAANSDLMSLIDRARKEGRAASLGKRWHNSELRARRGSGRVYSACSRNSRPHGAILHGVADDVTQRDLARAINRMIGTDEHTDSLLACCSMLGASTPTQVREHRKLVHPRPPSRSIGYQPVAEANACPRTRPPQSSLDWSPQRADVGDDIAFSRSYANM